MIDYAFTDGHARTLYGGELKRGTDGSAGLDLIACRISQIGKIALVQFGIAVDVRPGNCGLIFMRSGFAADTGLSFTNAVGVIDSDYRGELIGKIIGFFPSSYISARMAQLVVVKCDMDAPRLMDKLPETARGAGGFGSTGQ